MKTISQQIRQAITDSPMSMYALAEAAGVQRSMLTRFMAGEVGLTLNTVDKLAPLLGLKIVAVKPIKRKGR